MFKKKIWKRGDKLNAKELNRIEQGGFYVITVDEDVTNMNTTGPVFTNWSIPSKDITALTEANQKICLQCNVMLTREGRTEHVQEAWLYSTHCETNSYYLIGYIPSLGLIKANLFVDKEEDEIVINFDVIVPEQGD